MPDPTTELAALVADALDVLLTAAAFGVSPRETALNELRNTISRIRSLKPSPVGRPLGGTHDTAPIYGPQQPGETPQDVLRPTFERLAESAHRQVDEAMANAGWHTEEPEEPKYYLVTTDYSSDDPATTDHWDGVRWREFQGHVLAWRHLPKQYVPPSRDAEPPDSPTAVEPEDVSVPKPLCSDVGAPPCPEPAHPRRECWVLWEGNTPGTSCIATRPPFPPASDGWRRMTELRPGAVVLTRGQALEVRHLLRDSCFEDGSGPKFIPASCVLSDETRRALGIEVEKCE